MISLTKSLKGNPTAGYDDIPESLVKQCIQLIKGTLTHIYNVSLNSGTSQINGKQQEWNLYIKREIAVTCWTTDQYQ